MKDKFYPFESVELINGDLNNKNEEYERLVSSLKTMSDILKSRTYVLEKICESAKDAVTDADLDFAKFSLSKGMSDAYCIQILKRMCEVVKYKGLFRKQSRTVNKSNSLPSLLLEDLYEDDGNYYLKAEVREDFGKLGIRLNLYKTHNKETSDYNFETKEWMLRTTTVNRSNNLDKARTPVEAFEKFLNSSTDEPTIKVRYPSPF